MKIEKVNDHQIRCTLTKNDLADRELKISELAYGTEKAKSLFRDMMQQAAYQFGFEADDIPLMIEAIPLNSDCIVLIITKVEDPEELDTRFSNFAPSVRDSDDEEDFDDTDSDLLDIEDASDDVLDLFRKLQESDKEEKPTQSKVKPAETQSVEIPSDSNQNVTKIFSFPSLNDLGRVSHQLSGYYHGSNSLFKNTANGQYLLVVSKDTHTPNEFNKVCNTLSEYGYVEKSATASLAYLEEHYDSMIKTDALKALSEFL